MISQNFHTRYNKRILLIGSNSFLGKNIISEIPYKKIICIQRNKKNIIRKKNLKYYFLDLKLFKKLKKIINDNIFDKVIICCADNNNSINLHNNNIKIFNNNTNILLNIFECLKFKKKIEILNFTSSEVLKKKITIYSISKNTNNKLCEFYKKNYKLKIKNIILTNVFGGNDLNFNRIVPFLIRCAIFNKKIILKNSSYKLKLIYIENLLKILTLKLNNKYFNHSITILGLKKKILYIMKLKKNKRKKIYFKKDTLNFYLLNTISWYEIYFNKNNIKI